MRAKFENWNETVVEHENQEQLLNSEVSSIETTKNIRAKFESMKMEPSFEKKEVKVHRFVVSI